MELSPGTGVICCPAGANRHDSPLLAATLDKLDDLGPLPDQITVHLDAGYDSQKTRDELAAPRDDRADRL